MSAGPKAAHDAGWALVSVLWVVTALTLLAASTEELTTNAYRMERGAITRAEIDASLDAAVARAALGIAAPDIYDRWRVDGTLESLTFGGVAMRISVQDELGRFDLNVVDGSILSALFHAEGVPQDKSDALVDSIIDWRDVSGLHSLHGATNADYAAAGLPYLPRHGPFRSVDELRLVLGMTPDLFARISPALTVYSKRPMIDPAIGTPEALLALFAGDRQKVDNIVAEREETTANGAPAGAADPLMSLAGRAYSITAFAHANGRDYTRRAVIMLTGANERPYLTLDWR